MIRAARFAAIIILVGLAVGLVAYSVRAISFMVGDKQVNELAVTDLSLTHSVQRGPDGKLFNPFEPTKQPTPKPVTDVEQPESGERPSVETPANSCDLQEMLAKKKAPAKAKVKAKSAPKKPKAKPLPQAKPKPKPEPQQPPEQPIGGGQACPT